MKRDAIHGYFPNMMAEIAKHERMRRNCEADFDEQMARARDEHFAAIADDAKPVALTRPN